MKQKIVVIGGGFAGMGFARNFNNKSSHEVLLIDKFNHHMFQPLFYQVACGRLEPSNISFPFRKVFQDSKNIQYRMQDVQKIVPENNEIITDSGTISYDQLVIATGCRTNFFGNDKMQQLTSGMKSTEEAIAIRNQILMHFEQLANKGEGNATPSDWNIVIVGSGATGVELSGAFAEMRTQILPRDYPFLDHRKVQIVLISATAKPLNVMSGEAQDKSEEYLKKLGVDFRNNQVVADYDGETVTLKSGETLPSKNVIWAAGVSGNIIEGIEPEKVFHNRYIVDRYNRVKGYENIFAIGDIAYMETPKYPQGHPQVANVAINQGKNLSENLRKTSEKDWKEYEYLNLGSMATIGNRLAVVDLPHWKFQGAFAWYVWMFLHLMLILTTRNRVFIFFNWAWNYLNKDSSLRLIFRNMSRKQWTMDNG